MNISLEKYSDRTIFELYDLLSQFETFRFENNYCLSAIWKTGKFELYDYDAGLLRIAFHIKHPDTKYPGVISISTVDDGTWQAYSNDPLYFTRERCIEISQSLQDRFCGCLPTEKELNNFLLQYNIYGTFTG